MTSPDRRKDRVVLFKHQRPLNLPFPHKPTSPKEAGDRVCLKCNKYFWSVNASNRICSTCTIINASITIPPNRQVRDELDDAGDAPPVFGDDDE